MGFLSLFVTMTLAAEPAAPSAAPPPPALQVGARMELDDRVVRGSTAPGAVVLLHRPSRPLPSLVAPRLGLRERIVWPILGPVPIADELPPTSAGEGR